MNIIVWILQILLTLWNIIGGTYMSTNYRDLINIWSSNVFPSFFWIGLGIIQVIFSLGLILSLNKKFRKFAPISAISLAMIALFGIPVFTSYAGFPGLLWGVVPAILLIFVAYWRGSKQ